MKKTLTAFALTFGLTTTAFAAPLDLTGFQRVGDVSNGAGGIFYAFDPLLGLSLLTDDFNKSLEFNLDASGGDFQGITSNGLFYDFFFLGGSISIDQGGSKDSFFDIVELGFAGNSIDFLLNRNDANSLGSDPYPGSAGAIFSLTSQDFSPAQGTTLDTASTLEQFFIDNSDLNGEYAADVTFSIQALDAVSAVPAPATLALFAIGLVGLVGLGISRRRARFDRKFHSAA
ncbi:PEP-CTERM sorting domain-containing protein [Halochromatium salexigens]|uniref:Ice-binding protein C-terminal domain-containing protein n=1 Tax=Halochromatium salexigens TaxID=49447 RepID=A0AAJ0UDJ1_HALSE|nr:PEP-CTERM sorting domain-containing protein [Halochromatium salexigens]MBK5929348.1 hypothetical protein [Halochromatium salexigens]